MKKWLVILLIFVAILLPACNKIDNDNNKNVTITEEVKKSDENKTIEVEDMNIKKPSTIDAIPERDRYMFSSGTCEGELPPRENITKIAISLIGKPDEMAPYIVLYGVMDFKEKTIEYSYTEGNRNFYEPEPIQKIELTDEEISGFLDTLDGSFLTEEIEFEEIYGKIAIEYDDETCYAYQITEGRYTYGTPANNMLCAFFKKMELSESDRMYMFLN